VDEANKKWCRGPSWYVCSQGKLAVQVGVTHETINSIEKGGRFHPNLRLAIKIARAFGKQVGDVFIYEDIGGLGAA
jgi:DNA-binding XRE family transcriptional regulator